MKRIQHGRPISIAGSWQNHRSRSGWYHPRRPGHNSHRSLWPSRLFLTAASGGIMLIVAFWAAFWAPWLRVSDVRIEGAAPATAEAVKNLIYDQFHRTNFLILPQDNILVFDIELAKRTISGNVIFDDLKIEKKLPNQLIVSVREKTVRAVFWDRDRFWALDGTGFVVREANERELKTLAHLPPEISSVEEAAASAAAADGDKEPPQAEPRTAAAGSAADRLDSGYPLILGAADKKIAAPGDIVVPPALMSLILQAHARLPGLAEPAAWFNIMNGKDSVEAVMEGGWRVFLTSNAPFDVQAARLVLVLKDKVGSRRAELDYADLRYDERIFLRFKDGTTK
jgi:hypothetical protein